MRFALATLFSVFFFQCNSQFLMDMVDTTTDVGKSVLSVSQRFDHIRIAGYMQPQFQVAQEKGAKSFNGGDFALNVNNRIMLRRGRIRFDYVHFNKNDKASVQFVFQFDGTERGVFIRDFWGRIFENKYQLFSFAFGMFARPFSYELNLSSSDRESPERGRMSQILMKTERDLGAMVSFEPRKQNHPLRYLKVDAGLFNGQGLTAPGDFDSHKDFIARAGLKPYPIKRNLFLSFAASYLNGGLLQSTRYIYSINDLTKSFNVDSTINNLGKIAPRKYYGADAQLKIKCKPGFTEFRAEYITGKQTGLANTTETPPVLPDASGSYYIRRFDGAYFYFLQNFISRAHQLIIKYDWYDPNINVSKKDIGKTGNSLTNADIKFSTLGFGYIHYINENVKLMLWYDKVWNEQTQLTGYTADVKDDIFTCRLQFRF
ncbi:MAG: porin [Ginsengibacter sp.]